MTYAPPPAFPAPTPRSNGLAIAALVVGIAAFVFGLVPFLGILIAITGIVLAAIALGRPGSKVMPGVGLVLSGIATLANIAVIVAIFVFVPTLSESPNSDSDDFPISEEESDDESETPELTLATTTTPCFSFDAPAEFITNQSTADDELCLATREGWGEMDDDGTITYTGVGAVWDQVLVEPIRVESTNTWVPDGELDTMVDYLEANYFPQLGEIITLRETMTLDGVEANLTRIDSPAESTVTKATLVVKSEQPYETANGPVQFFLITFVIDDERGDLIIDALVDSWQWN